MKTMRYAGNDISLVDRTALVMPDRDCVGYTECPITGATLSHEHVASDVGREMVIVQFDDLATGKGYGWWPFFANEFEEIK